MSGNELQKLLENGKSLLITSKEGKIHVSLYKNEGGEEIKLVAEDVIGAVSLLSGKFLENSCERYATHYLQLSDARVYLLSWLQDCGFLCRIQGTPSSEYGSYGQGENPLVAIENAVKATMHYTP